MLNRKATILSVTLLALACSSVLADDNAPVIRTARKRDTIALDAGPSTSIQRGPTAQELIQARAWNRHLHREAKLQANAWYGYEPLRPTLSGTPYAHPVFPVYRPVTIWTIQDYTMVPW